MLQADLEMSSETLRAALAEAKGQLVSAKERNHRSHLQLSEKNTILERCDMYGVCVCVCIQLVFSQVVRYSRWYDIAYLILDRCDILWCVCMRVYS